MPVIYVNGKRLATITEQDADQQGEEDRTLAAQLLSRLLTWELQRAKRERQPQFLARQ
ncbi:MAG: mechanosensitive ion channel family protein, partial [Okeania sp. SIO2C9]|nr:mechanosensitive ion channel family protein [Okeania sp. SIO2C9]